MRWIAIKGILILFRFFLILFRFFHVVYYGPFGNMESWVHHPVLSKSCWLRGMHYTNCEMSKVSSKRISGELLVIDLNDLNKT